jgi:hypothetical protein
VLHFDPVVNISRVAGAAIQLAVNSKPRTVRMTLSKCILCRTCLHPCSLKSNIGGTTCGHGITGPDSSVVAACAGNASTIAFMRQHATAADHTDSSDPGKRCPCTNAMLCTRQPGRCVRLQQQLGVLQYTCSLPGRVDAACAYKCLHPYQTWSPWTTTKLMHCSPLALLSAGPTELYCTGGWNYEGKQDT